MVDARDLKSCARKGVRVRVPQFAPLQDIVFVHDSGFPETQHPETLTQGLTQARGVSVGEHEQGKNMLQSRETGFYFRTKVPSRFRDILNKHEICFSLFTKSRKVALIRAGTVYERTQNLFAKIECSMANQPWLMSDDDKREYLDVLQRSTLPPDAGQDQAERDSLAEFVRLSLKDQQSKEFFDAVIESYRKDIESLIVQYKTINAEHLLLYIKESERSSALAGYLQDTAGPVLEKLVRSGEVLASRVQGQKDAIRTFENHATLLRETLSPVFKQLEVKPSPLFSEAVKSFMASPDVAGRPNSELAMMANVYRRWLEINGDRPIRTYSSRHADKYIEMMSKISATYRKGKTRELTVDELIKHTKGKRIKDLVTTKTIKNHFSKLSIMW